MKARMKPMKMKFLKNAVALLERPGRSYLPVLALVLAVSSQACSTTRPSRAAMADIEPFRSDGCSCIPDGPRLDPDRWRSSCEDHDRSYWKGGSRRERLVADRILRDSVRESGNPCAAEIIFVGVRFGGSPWFPTPWRWGFGHPWPRGYQKPSAP